MRTRAFLVLTVLSLLLYQRRASACGACLAPSSTVTSVDAHRMVIAPSPNRTVLWDQIQYSGNPEDFVWILPVPSPEVTVELADGEFFDEIDAFTAPRVQAKPLSRGSGGTGCGEMDAGSSSRYDDDVTVYETSIVGPYETLTIGSEDAGALYAWLLERDYQVSPEAADTMDEYIAAGNVFVILRLAPDVGVKSMQPVRVTYPGYMGSFPLKMVRIGANGTLKLALWIIADERYQAVNYPSATIRQEELTYDWNTGAHNYDELFLDAIDRAGGRAWITEFAGPPIFRRQSSEWAYAGFSRPYVTRLRTEVYADYLTEDLQLGLAEEPAPVTNVLIAATELNRPGDDDDGSCRASRRVGGFWPLMALALFAALRRRSLRLGAKS